MSAKNGLLLYFHPHSYYSQRVVIALIEKEVPYSERIINLLVNEHFESWYLELSPKAEVPVLRDGVNVIPDSGQIIAYLEDNFNNGVYKRLVPLNLLTYQQELMEDFRDKIDAVDMNTITNAAMVHSHLVSNPKYPFILSSARDDLVTVEAEMPGRLRDLAESHPDLKDILLQKALKREEAHEVVVDIELFKKELQNVRRLLKTLNDQLACQPDEHWLICKDYTIVDVYLTCFLNRLSRIGLEYRLWNDLPHISCYFNRVQRRQSYIKANDTIRADVTHLWNANKGIIITVLAIIVIFIVLIIIYIFH